jgi:hypothetical protein
MYFFFLLYFYFAILNCKKKNKKIKTRVDVVKLEQPGPLDGRVELHHRLAGEQDGAGRNVWGKGAKRVLVEGDLRKLDENLEEKNQDFIRVIFIF